jgi:hypothetical protein
MTPVAAVAFYQTKMLEDLAAVASDGGGYLVTVDHTYEMVQPAEPITEKADWRFWAPGKDGLFHEVSRMPVSTPSATSVVMTVQDGRLIALAQVGEPQPAWLLPSAMRLGNPPQFAGFGQAVAVRLNPAEAAQVHVADARIWNTRLLPPHEWLFHPSLTSLAGTHEVAIALNAADGRAAVWLWDGAQKSSHTVAFVPAALNPVYLRRGNKNYLLYRKMPADWSVFYHDARYSGSLGPVALPLAMAELDDAGAPARTADLSKDAAVGEVFDFAADIVAGNRLVLAAVTGSKAEPELRVYVSGEAGAPRLRQSLPIRAAPFRLTMTAAGGRILVGLAYKVTGGFVLEGLALGLE